LHEGGGERAVLTMSSTRMNSSVVCTPLMPMPG
jgi:hypothetical protein